MLRLCFRTVSNDVWPATDKCVGWGRDDDVKEPGTEGSFMDRLQAGGKVLHEQTVCLFDEATMHRLAANNPVATTEARRPAPLPPPPSPPLSSLRRACPRTGAGEKRGGGRARGGGGCWLLLLS